MDFLVLRSSCSLFFYGELLQVPEFEEAAFTAPLNKVVKCKTQFGWHLLQVLSERCVFCYSMYLFSELSSFYQSWLLGYIFQFQGRICTWGHSTWRASCKTTRSWVPWRCSIYWCSRTTWSVRPYFIFLLKKSQRWKLEKANSNNKSCMET